MKNNNIFVKLSLAIVCIYMIVLTVVHRQNVFEKTDIDALRESYVTSNYVLGDRGHKMSDEEVYTYAGYVYVTGESPMSVNFEHPPFIKYLYGVSTTYLGNPNIIVAIFVLVEALCIIYLAKELYVDKRLVVIATLLFLSNSLVYWYFSKALLDIPLTGMMLLVVVLYTKYMKKPSFPSALLFGVISGLYLCSKYAFPLSVGLFGVLLLTMLVKHGKIWHVVAAIGMAGISYISLYFAFFLKGNTIIDFIKFEVWRLNWYMGKTDGPKALILQTIFFGKHRAWWAYDGSMVTYPNYTILWPITCVVFLVSLFKKMKHAASLIPYKIWTLGALLVLLLGASNDFYLIPLLPGFILFGVKIFDREGTT